MSQAQSFPYSTSEEKSTALYPLQYHTRGDLANQLKQRSARLRICRGCPHRDLQRCNRSGRECHEHANEGFCPAGMFGVDPGTWPSGYHNEPLYRETLAAPPPAPDPFVGQPIVHLGCHLWPVIHPDEPTHPWLDQIRLWHELAEQINGRCLVGVATGPNTATFAEIAAEFDTERFELFELPNDEEEGENPTFRQLLEMLPSGPDDVLIYCHAKGVQAARRNSEAVQLWRELLYETVPFNWRRGVEKLAEGYKAFGSFRAFTTSRNVIPHGWYYSGTFFIGRLKHFFLHHFYTESEIVEREDLIHLEAVKLVSSRKPLPVTPCWGGVEHFLGTHFPAQECWCEFADGRDLGEEYSIARMFPQIVHSGFRWEMERLQRQYGVHCEQHVRELEFLLEEIMPGDRVLVIGSRAGGIESVLKQRVESVTTVSIDPEPLASNPHQLIIGSSHDTEVQLYARSLGPYDVVFIDGDHTEAGVREDWEFAQKLKPRLVAFHDIADTTFHRSLNCNVAPLWRELQARYITSEKIVGGGWGGIGVVELRETLAQDADERAEVDVSIIITVGPGYERYAEKAIRSAVTQTGPNRCEVIVVWDGSQDPDDVLLPAYRSYSVEFRNVQKSRRFGVEKARGRYTLFLDADDWLPEGFVAEALEQLQHAEAQDHRVAGVYPSAEYVDLKTGTVESRVPARSWDRTLLDAANFLVISTLCRTEELRNARWGGSDMRTLEDHEMWLSVVERGVRFVPGLGLTLNVGLHEDSLSRKVVHKDYADLHAIASKPITMILIGAAKESAFYKWSKFLPNHCRRTLHIARDDGFWDSLNQAIQDARTPFVWIIDGDVLPQMSARDALQELAAGFEADVAAVCGLTGSRAIDTDQRFATIDGSGFSCVLARTRALQDAGPLYAPTEAEPWPDQRFWARVYFAHNRVRVANRVPCAHVDRQLEILTYHEVDPDNPSTWSITPELLRAHLTWLRDNGWRFTTLDDAVLHYGPAGKQVVITFDDGRLGCWDHAAAILKEFNIKATFFICPQMTDGLAADDQRYTDFMSWSEVVALSEDGHTIGNHASDHVRLDEHSGTRVSTLVEVGKMQVEEMSGVIQCDHFAPPYGSTSAEVVRVAKQMGHRTVCTTEERRNPMPIDPYRLGRRQITNGTTVEQLAAMLGGDK